VQVPPAGRGPAAAGRRRRGAERLALGYIGLVLGLALVQGLAPQRNGLLALTQVLAPQLFWPLLLLAPLGWKSGPGLRLGLGAGGVVYVLLFAPHWIAPPAPAPPVGVVDVMAWNVYRDGRQMTGVRHVLATSPAALVALPEAPADVASGDAATAQRYPYQLVAAQIVLLSRYPIAPGTTPPGLADLQQAGRLVWGRIAVGLGAPLTVVAVHLQRADFVRDAQGRWVGFDATQRDRQIAQVRALIAPLLQAPAPLLLLGDFNLTEREPAYQDLAGSLQDAYPRSGAGLGNTWQPDLPFGQAVPVLRIDYIWSNAALRPLGTGTDCTRRGSDHCILFGRLALP